MVFDDEPPACVHKGASRPLPCVKPTRGSAPTGARKYLLPQWGHSSIVCHEPPANCCAGLVLTSNVLLVEALSFFIVNYSVP